MLAAGSILFLLFVALFTYTGNYLFVLVPFALLFFAWAVIDWKSLYWFFLFCIPLSCDISLFNGKLSTTIPDEQLMWLFCPVFFLVFFSGKKVLPEWFLRNPLTLILALQFLWLIMAVLFSENLFLSVKYLLSQTWFWVSFLLLPILVFREKEDFKRAFLLIGIPLVLHAIFAFCWHYTVHFNYWESNKVVRPFYVNHVDYSTVLSMFFPLLIVAYQLCKGQRRKRTVLLAVIVFFIPAIYAAGARAAILAVAFAFVIAFAIRKKLVNWVMPVIYAIIITAVVFLVHNNKYYDLRPNMKYTATQPTFAAAVTGMFTGNDMSSMERFYRWIAVARMSNDRPITGVGPNNFYDYYKNYTVTAFKTWVSRNEERSTTHNYFLFMLAEQGYPAMLLYAMLMIAIFAQAQRTYHRARDPFYKKVTMGLAMLLAAGFVNNFFSELIDTHKVGALFYIAVALLIVVSHKVKQQASMTESKAS